MSDNDPESKYILVKTWRPWKSMVRLKLKLTETHSEHTLPYLCNHQSETMKVWIIATTISTKETISDSIHPLRTVSVENYS